MNFFGRKLSTRQELSMYLAIRAKDQLGVVGNITSINESPDVPWAIEVVYDSGESNQVLLRLEFTNEDTPGVQLPIKAMFKGYARYDSTIFSIQVLDVGREQLWFVANAR